METTEVVRVTTRKTYKLAPIFTMDHHDRGCGQTDEVKLQTKTYWAVEMDIDGYRDMLTDAAYYVEFQDEMEGLESICRSAGRVLEVLVEEGPPDGYELVGVGGDYIVKSLPVYRVEEL